MSERMVRIVTKSAKPTVKIFLIIIFVCMSGLFFSCGDANTSSDESSSEESSSEDSSVSIDGGVPSAKHFSVSSNRYNLPGLAYNNEIAQITAYLADRFGNYDVLIGTAVSFIAEAGLTIDSSSATSGADGIVSVDARTQISISPDVSSPENVLPEVWEVELQDYITATYGYTPTGHPRDGKASILVFTLGEEYFSDTNSNEFYDTGETFVDTISEDPLCDFNDNGVFDDGTAGDPEEIYIDTTDDGLWTGLKNGVWDSRAIIYTNIKILVTGRPMFLTDTTTFSVANGDSQNIKIVICDQNLNPLPPETTITISADAGKLSGTKKTNLGETYEDLIFEFENSNAIGPDRDAHLSIIEKTLRIQDADPENDLADDSEEAMITVTVNWKDQIFSWTIQGTID